VWRLRVSGDVVEKSRETKVHVELLVAVEHPSALRNSEVFAKEPLIHGSVHTERARV
jgi:hypothetical protein